MSSLSLTGYQAENNANNYLLLCLENICKIPIEGFFILKQNESIFLLGTSAIGRLVSLETYHARILAGKKKHVAYKHFHRGINLMRMSKSTALHQDYS